MKRIVLILIALLMVISSMSSCKSNKATNSVGFSQDDLIFNIKNNSLKCNTDVSAAIKVLGKDYKYSESKSCEYDGLDKIYIYSSFSIYTYPQGNKDMISEIMLTDKAYGTKKNIKIGMKKSDIIKAYGEGFMTGTVLTYNLTKNPDDLKSATLYFTLDESDTITSLGITADKSK